MKIILIVSLFSWLNFCFSQEKKEDLTFEEKENEIIDYSNIKNVLRKDGLEDQVEKRKSLVKKIKKEKIKIQKKHYDYPDEENFWKIMSELWLVKNAQLLRWDFPKPDYGIKSAFENLLVQFGYYNIEFKILIVNNPVISHFGLPSGKDSYIFILSLPFMRGLDLTKVDISLLLLEDFFRLKLDQFKNNLKFDKKIIGSNFEKKTFSKELFTPLLKQYSELIMKNGFSFEQQFLTTKEMDKLLKSTPPLWDAYFKMYAKIDRFVKSDILFKNYLKVYPSPEFQLKWLSPEKKVI